MTRFAIGLLFFILPAVVAQDYMAIYNEGVSLIETGQPAEARLKFQEVLKSPQDTGLHDNAEYWIAVSYFDEKRFDSAIEHYRRAQVVPDGNKAAAAQYELAVATSEAGDTSSAVMEFYKLKTLYPGSGLSERADEKVKSLGGPTEAKIPDYGPLTPTLAEAAPVKPEPKLPEPRPTPEPEQPTEPEVQPDTTQKPEEPAPAEPVQTKPRRRTVEPVPLGSVPQEPVDTLAGEAVPPGTVAETGTTELVSSEIEPEPTKLASAETEPESATAETRPGETPVEVVMKEKIPLSGDPRSLIRPDDKRGF